MCLQRCASSFHALLYDAWQSGNEQINVALGLSLVSCIVISYDQLQGIDRDTACVCAFILIAYETSDVTAYVNTIMTLPVGNANEVKSLKMNDFHDSCLVL